MLEHFNPSGDSPVRRLSPETRNLAADYLGGTLRARNRLAAFRCESTGPDPFTALGKHAVTIAEQAPLELNPNELLAGSAPFLDAIRHRVPGSPFQSVSHTTADFGDAIRLGLSGLERELRQGGTPFHSALLNVVAAMRIWTGRQAEALDKLGCGELAARLRRVPEHPPENFADALQSFWSFFEFQRLCGNWSGLGRFDRILGDYLKRDLERGVITLDEARERVAHFWIKGAEWCYGPATGNPLQPGSGDAQNYQNIILGGLLPDGSILENEVTHLVLDVVEELHISDYPIAVRTSPRTSPELLERIAAIQLLGGGIVSIYQEDVVIAGLERFGIPREDAVEFTNDGCWEAIIPGKTSFSYLPFDALLPFQEALWSADHPSFEVLYEAWTANLEARCRELALGSTDAFADDSAQPGTVISLLMPACRNSGRSYMNRGSRYTVKALHAGGLPDVANSLTVIKRLVYKERQFSLSELLNVLERNWTENDGLKKRIQREIPLYGNDDAAADAMLRRVFDSYTSIVEKLRETSEVLHPAGVSTFGREIQFAPFRRATAFGKRAGEYLAPNLSPTPGTDFSGVTAVVKSYCKMDFTRTPNGCPLDLTLDSAFRRNPRRVELLAALLKSFIELGGWYLQVDVLDPAILRLAQKEPDRFPNLAVRISGWSARFASLAPEWQELVIRRIEQR